jgi:hypothetical protein
MFRRIIAALSTLAAVACIMPASAAHAMSTTGARTSQPICVLRSGAEPCFKDEGSGQQVQLAGTFYSNYSRGGQQSYNGATWYQWLDGSGRCIQMNSSLILVSSPCNGVPSFYWHWDTVGGKLENLYGFQASLPYCVGDSAGYEVMVGCSIGTEYYL